MSDPALSFFQRLFRDSLDLVARFPLTREPAPMAHVTAVLEPAVEAERPRNPFAEPGIDLLDQKRAEVIDAGARPVIGLNTTGMLLDRLSILAIKHWNLVNRAQKPAAADELVRTQVDELVWALARAHPGQSSINNKMTSRQVDSRAETFSDAYYGLFTTNMLLWESQEVLYNHDILALPCEELRRYIDFFSRGNLARNAYIQSSDGTFWSLVRGRD